MTPQILLVIFAGLGFLLALLGWAYQLGFFNARLIRNERDIAELKEKSDRSEKEFRTEVRESFGKVYEKIDALPCRNPGWRKENCG